jgi:hypothetical protein
MRVLLTLIKRQIIDGAAYFVAATVFATILSLVILIVAFKYNFYDLLHTPFHTTALFIPLPLLIALSFCARGIAQTYTDRTKGISKMLSVLPITHSQMSLSYIISGIILIMNILIPVAITLVVLCALKRPLIPPFWELIRDICIGIFLMVLACYCLGLQMGCITETFTLALGALPLSAFLILLLLVKGFGIQLNIILLLFITASLLSWIKASKSSLKTNIAKGFMVLVLLVIPLYCCRLLCHLSLISHIPEEARTIYIKPSGLAPQIENDPNAVEPSLITASFAKPTIKEFVLADNSFSHIWDIINPFYVERRGPSTDIYEYDSGSGEYLYFDKEIGLFVYRASMWRLQNHIGSESGPVKLYVGPKGISQKPETNLGRFPSSIAQHEYSKSIVVYDRQLRRFFAIDFGDRTVEQGPELKNPTDSPIEIGSAIDSRECSVRWTPPQKIGQYAYPGEKDRLRTWKRPLITSYQYSTRKAGDFVLVLDRSGRIDLLDRKTLEPIRPAGYLPHPKTIWGINRFPAHLLAYGVRPLEIGYPRQYAGMIVASLSRQGTSMVVAVFDKYGKKIKSADSESTFFNVPGGPALAITKYIFETLHPPVLTLASFFTAYSFDARSTHRAMFLMPDSFVAMARDYEGNIFYKFMLVLLLMLPGILFAALLGWRVTRDAAIIGLSNNARRFWLAGTLVFGLPAYITYRLTRPKITLVTCANCGKPRRPDADICHHCGSKWDVPELKPPDWRVFDI